MTYTFMVVGERRDKKAEQESRQGNGAQEMKRMQRRG
jgi:hypothetical protein